MKKDETDSAQVSHPTHRVRLPGFVNDEDIGLGDAIKHMTYALGIRPCGGCERRAATLNRWFVLKARAK